MLNKNEIVGLILFVILLFVGMGSYLSFLAQRDKDLIESFEQPHTGVVWVDWESEK